MEGQSGRMTTTGQVLLRPDLRVVDVNFVRVRDKNDRTFHETNRGKAVVRISGSETEHEVGLV